MSTPGTEGPPDRSGAGELIDLWDLATSHEVGPVPDRHHGDPPLYLSNTSGTTGMLKGAILDSGPVTLGTACIAERLGLSRHDVLLATTPTSSSFQLVASLMPAIHVGASLVLISPACGPSSPCQWRRGEVPVCIGLPLLSDVVNLDNPGSLPFELALLGISTRARIKRMQGMPGHSSVESYRRSGLGGLGRPRPVERRRRRSEWVVGRADLDLASIIWDQRTARVPAGQWERWSCLRLLRHL